MNLVKTLLATTLTFAAATTFAAEPTTAPQEDENVVVVSTQELPEEATQDTATAQPSTAQPDSEAAADASATPVNQPQ